MMSNAIQRSESISKLAAAKQSAMKSISNIEKDGQHTQFKYATHEAIVRAVRKHLLANDLTLAVSSEVVSSEQVKSGHLIVLRVTARLSHVSGEWEQTTATGEGVDRGDKAAYKALTGGLKYWLRANLLLPIGDDPEEESDDPAADYALAFNGAVDGLIKMGVADPVGKLTEAMELKAKTREHLRTVFLTIRDEHQQRKQQEQAKQEAANEGA